MSKRLWAVNAVMVALAALCVVYIVRQAMTPLPMPGPGRARPVTQATGAPVDASRAPASAYGVVTARNLFSPTRSEAPSTGGPAVAGPPLVKPNLFGVVLREGSPIAYLEDPTTKRVAGYRVGDSIVGGIVKTISADGVVIARPDGNVDVQMRDPSRPRTVATPGQQPGVPGTQPIPGQLPGVIPPAASAVPGEPGQAGQPPTFVPGRRSLPPNLLRRLPQAPPSDAPQR